MSAFSALPDTTARAKSVVGDVSSDFVILDNKMRASLRLFVKPALIGQASQVPCPASEIRTDVRHHRSLYGDWRSSLPVTASLPRSGRDVARGPCAYVGTAQTLNLVACQKNSTFPLDTRATNASDAKVPATTLSGAQGRPLQRIVTWWEQSWYIQCFHDAVARRTR